MAKKIIGALFLVFAVIIVVSSIANGSLFADHGSAPATYGAFLGILLPVIANIASGILFLTFDNVLNKPIIEGFKTRGKQAAALTVFAIVYVFLSVAAYLSILASFPETFFEYLVILAPFLVPLTIFFVYILSYARPYWVCKKQFLNNENAKAYYLSDSAGYTAKTADGYVCANDAALFFPTLCCVVPFEHIASVELKTQLIEKDIYFNLKNGKKFYIVSNHFDTIQKLVAEKTQVQ